MSTPTAEPGRLLPVSSPRRTRQAVLAQVRRRPVAAVTAAVALGAAAAASLVTAPLLGDVVDLALARDQDGITARVLLLLAAAAAQAVLAYVGLVAVAMIGEAVLAGLREDFVVHALGLELPDLERGGSGDLTSRITEDVAMVSDAVRTAVPEFVQAALVIVLTVLGLAVLDWRFAVAALIAAPVQGWTTRWYVRRSTPLYADRRRAAGAEQQQLLETIGGAGTVRAFDLVEDQVGLVRERADRSVELVIGVTRLQTRFFGRLNVAELIGLAAVLTTGFVLVDRAEVTVGTASAAAIYFTNLFSPVNSVLFLLDTLQAATASLARLVGITEVAGDGSTDPDPDGRGATAPAEGSLQAAGLRYAYVEGHDVLHGVDLDVPAGATVAVVGTSGGGKSSLAALIAGIRRPSAGQVRIGGVPLEQLDPAQLRRCVVLVTQEVHVFAGPLADDLLLAAPDADAQAIDSALAAVGATGWVRSLPDGIDTVVGEGGHEVSPEQAQQVALARVVLADPLVVILDEATAEAGSSDSRVLDTAAGRVLDGRTGIVVAHRFSQTALADQVLVMEHGRVVERGKHEDLLATGGRYAELWRAWSDRRD
jgi:ATP-binding cassette subfamily C protein